MKHCRCFLIVLAVFASALPVSGSDFTLFGGFNRPGRITLGDASGAAAGAAGDFLSDPKGFGVFGARLFRSNSAMGLEHTVAWSPNFLSSDASAFIFNTNLLVQLPAFNLRPYATAGVGVVRASGSGPGAFGTKFGLNYGAGAKALLLGPWGLRLDVRGYSIRGVESQNLRVLEGSVGLFYAF